MYSKKFLHLLKLTLGISAGILCVNAKAIAAESVTMTYNTDQVTVSLDEIQHFANTGKLTPQLKSFFHTTGKVPPQWSQLLTTEIQIPAFVERFIESPRGRYVLHQVEQMVYSSNSQGVKDLDTALIAAMADQKISIFEVLRDYPQRSINVNLNIVEKDYNEVKQLVEALEHGNWKAATPTFLTEILCHCNASTNNGTINHASDLKPKLAATGHCLGTISQKLEPQLDRK